jgi:hypothetical protein
VAGEPPREIIARPDPDFSLPQRLRRNEEVESESTSLVDDESLAFIIHTSGDIGNSGCELREHDHRLPWLAREACSFTATHIACAAVGAAPASGNRSALAIVVLHRIGSVTGIRLIVEPNLTAGGSAIDGAVIRSSIGGRSCPGAAGAR